MNDSNHHTLTKQPFLSAPLNTTEQSFTLLSGELLRTIRRERGFSREQLGAAAGVSHQQVYKYENGQNRLSLCRLNTFLMKLNYAPQQFCAQLWTGNKLGWSANYYPNTPNNTLLEIITDMARHQQVELLKQLQSLSSTNSETFSI